MQPSSRFSIAAGAFFVEVNAGSAQKNATKREHDAILCDRIMLAPARRRTTPYTMKSLSCTLAARTPISRIELPL